LAYKPHTNVIEKSQGAELAGLFAARGVPVVVYDPCAMDAARCVMPGSVQFAASASDCARKADVLLLCTPSPEYKAVSAADLKRPAGKRAVVIDCWRMFDGAALSQVADYIAVGTADMATGRVHTAARLRAA